MTISPRSALSLWPADQLLITADTSTSISGMLHPKHQMEFLTNMTTFAGPGVFAGSLVYSTPKGNTGWTAFRAGVLGHIAFHHWDVPTPNLLQLDVYGIGSIDEAHALATVNDFWAPLGLRAFLITRPDPREVIVTVNLADRMVSRSSSQDGFGPGDHVQLMVDQIGPSPNAPWDASSLDLGVMDLVRLLKMRAMTPVYSNTRNQGGGFQYDAIVGITTSHISFRLRARDGTTSIALDIFSCRNFQPEVVSDWLDWYAPSPECRRITRYNRYPLGQVVAL